MNQIINIKEIYETHSENELEQVVLGSLLIDRSAFAEHHDLLYSELFCNKNHRLIFEVIKELWKENHPIDLITVSSRLEKRNSKLVSLLILLSSKVASTAHLRNHLMFLAELEIKRDYILKFNKLLQMAISKETDVFELQEKTFQYIDELFIDRFLKGMEKTSGFPELVENIEERSRSITEGKVPGIKSSLRIINKAFGGWQNSDLVIVAARPGMGKTAFLVQGAVDVVLQNKAIGIFSLEMSAEQIATRIITNYTEIPNSSILRKGFRDEELTRFLSLKSRLKAMKIHIDDTAAISVQNMRTKAKMMKLKYGIEILFVDYLQLMTNERNQQNRENEIGSISRGLKAIAKELDIPVIALSQLSRRVEQRPDKRPLLSDLRDSGSIEQDADEVLFLYRPEYYGIETWDDEYNFEHTRNQAEIIIQKNRHGGILSERVEVDMAISLFKNIEHDY